MKKKTKITILIVLSFLTAVALWTAASFKKMSELDIFNIEEDVDYEKIFQKIKNCLDTKTANTFIFHSQMNTTG